MAYRIVSVRAAVTGLVFLACAASSAQSAPVVMPTAPIRIAAVAPQKTAPQTKKSTAKPAAKKVEVNMNELFPPGKGRDLVLDNCMNCHSMAPIVVAQKTRGEWTQLGASHRSMAAQLNDEQYNQLLEYLIATFNPKHPVPQLPEELLSGWTNY